MFLFCYNTYLFCLVLQHPFIKLERPSDTIFTLVERTKNPDLQEANAAAMDAILRSVSEVTGMTREAKTAQPSGPTVPRQAPDAEYRSRTSGTGEEDSLSPIDEGPTVVCDKPQQNGVDVCMMVSYLELKPHLCVTAHPFCINHTRKVLGSISQPFTLWFDI